MLETGDGLVLLSVDEMTSLQELEKLEDVWDDVLSNSGVPHFSSTFAFIHSWWKHRRFNDDLLVRAHWNNDNRSTSEI